MSVASTISTLTSFPGPNSIPPACFYNKQGLAEWLNQNPTYKENFATTGAFPNLIPTNTYQSTLSTFGLSTNYNAQNVPLCSNVQTLSQYQAQQYSTQLNLFHKVYTTNSNAYINYISTGQGPIYYNFATNQELNNYRASVQLVNKLYPFQAMAAASSINWQIPFPIYM
jgi:hypothetical protein